MRRLSIKDPAEILDIPADFSMMLVGGEQTSGGGCTISVANGADASANAVLSGGPLTANDIVTQRVIGGLHGVDYVLHFTVNTDAGRTYAMNLLMRVRQDEV